MIKKLDKLPKHMAIIMDGNSRWASVKGYSREQGHYYGYKNAFAIIEFCLELGISELSLFVLSQENVVNRSKLEFDCLTNILVNALKNDVDKLITSGVKLNVIGDLSVFSKGVQKSLGEVIKLSRDNDVMQINLALNYSGKWHIQQAVQQAIAANISIDAADKWTSNWFVANISPCDLLIRTGAEQRVSNFLLWHLAYSEIYFSELYWPDFNQQNLLDSLDWFASRSRRFGGRSVE